MKTETQITIKVGQIKASQNLHSDADVFFIKIFFASSRRDTKPFKLNGLKASSLNQTLKISNIGGKQIQLWLCSSNNKIMANANITVPLQLAVQQQLVVDFKMTSTPIALLNLTLQVNRHEIQKPVYIEPDQQLLKKVQNPYQQLRKEQQQAKRLKQLQEQQLANKQIKKPAITITKFNKRDVPFV